MLIYEDLVNIIRKYSEKEIIIETNEIINALDLYNIVNDKFYNLRENIYYNFIYNNAWPHISSNGIIIEFCYDDYDLQFNLLKKDGIIYYFDTKSQCSKIYNQTVYREDIINMFTILEEYYKLFFDLETGKKNTMEFILLDKYFDIKILCNEYGEVYNKIVFDEKLEKSETIYNVSDPRVNRLINMNMKDILSKIPVKKSDLPSMFKQILEERKKKTLKKVITK